MANGKGVDDGPRWRNRASQLRRLTGGDIVLCPRCGDEMKPASRQFACPTCEYKTYRFGRPCVPDVA